MSHRIHRDLTIDELEPRIAPAAGGLDPTFGVDGLVETDLAGRTDRATSVAIQPDGRILVAGYSHDGTQNEIALLRYHPDGSLDTTFGDSGHVITPLGSDDYATDMALQPDGKIVLAGWAGVDGIYRDFAVLRYNPDGSLDTGFGGDGIVTTPIGTNEDQANAVCLQSDGKIVVAGAAWNGWDWDFAVVRYNPDGTLDITFGGDGKVITPIITTPGAAKYDIARAVAIQLDGRIVVAGYADGDFGVVRYDTDGSLDTSFDDDGIAITPMGESGGSAHAVSIQSDGKIVTAGYTYGDTTGKDFALVRYNTDGSLDPTFDGDGIVTTDFRSGWDEARGMVLQADGRIVVVGSSAKPVTPDDFAVARYNADGSLDTTFSYDGKLVTSLSPFSDSFRDVAIESDGNIIAVGYSGSQGLTNYDIALARYLGNNCDPAVADTVSDQVIDDKSTIAPFASVTIVDAEDESVAVTVALDDAAKGVFTAESLATSGFTDAGNGVYTLLSVSPAEAQAAIRQLVFDPTENRVKPHFTETTVFTITLDDSMTVPTSDSTTSVVSESVNDPPVIADQEFWVDENTPKWTVFGVIQATPPEMGEQIIYGILDSPGNTTFGIDNETGEIYVTNPTELDYETRTSIICTVQVKDSQYTTTTATVTIHINDLGLTTTVSDFTGSTSPHGIEYGYALTDGPGGRTKSGTLTLANTSDQAITITSVGLVDGADFDIGGFPDTPFVLAAGESLQGTVICDPSSIGMTMDTVRIVSDGPGGGTVDVHVSASAIEAVVLNAANPKVEFKDKDHDRISLMFKGNGEAWVATTNGLSPLDDPNQDIGFIGFNGSTDKSMLMARDMDPKAGGNTLVLGTVETMGGESMGRIMLMQTFGTVQDTAIEIDGGLGMLQILGNASNVDLSVGGDCGRALLMGSATNTTLDITGNLPLAMFRGAADTVTVDVDGYVRMLRVSKGIDQTTIDLRDDVGRLMLFGGMTDSTLTVTGHTTMVTGMGGQTDSTLNLNGGADMVMLYGGMSNTDLNATGNMKRCMIRGGMQNGSDLAIAGNLTMLQLMDGVSTGSTISVSGDVSMAMLLGPVGGDGVSAGCTATFGSLSKMLMVKGNLAGTVDIQGPCVAAGRNSLLKVLGNLTVDGKLIADLFGNVMILGDFLGEIGDAETTSPSGTANYLMVKGVNGGALLPDNGIFAEIR